MTTTTNSDHTTYPVRLHLATGVVRDSTACAFELDLMRSAGTISAAECGVCDQDVLECPEFAEFLDLAAWSGPEPVNPLTVRLRDHYVDLVVYERTWSSEAGTRLDAATATNPDLNRAAVEAALGVPEVVRMSSDGRGIHTDAWCSCSPQPSAADWVRYERWSPEGREAHGWACRSCRCLTQVG